MEIRQRIAKIAIGFQWKTKALSMVFTLNRTLKNIVIAVAKIMPMMAGRIPRITAFTPA